jgi:hypothetical protein
MKIVRIKETQDFDLGIENCDWIKHASPDFDGEDLNLITAFNDKEKKEMDQLPSVKWGRAYNNKKMEEITSKSK